MMIIMSMCLLVLSTEFQGSMSKQIKCQAVATKTPICRHVHQVNSPPNITAVYHGFQDRCGPFHTPLLNLKRNTE